MVVVASVPVLEVKVNFCSVDEPLTSKLEPWTRPVEVRLPVLAVWAKKLVVEAVPEE